MPFNIELGPLHFIQPVIYIWEPQQELSILILFILPIIHIHIFENAWSKPTVEDKRHSWLWNKQQK